ncbi:MAG: LytR C-terminal domain-containing protein [Gemmatimonadetes bacterium]|nr:LytR C-terminal domain-containing protein [Gemmatimonadota bacterium]
MRRATEVVVLSAVLLLAGSAIFQWIPDGEVGVSHDAPPGRTERITVEVRNAGGVQGMARSATDFLRGAGYDVVTLGNAESFDEDRSVVIDRVGEMRMARLVAETLGVDSVISEPDPELFVDVTVRLGARWTPPEVSRPRSASGGGGSGSARTLMCGLTGDGEGDS